MSNSLIIVESPTKAKTIKKFLGNEYVITSSLGHIRDLPNNASEVPAQFKGEKWANLGVNVDKDFEPVYVIPDGKKKHVGELKNLMKNASELLLATDEDREGESISWHLLEVLKPKIPVKRMVFHEITKDAIKKAIDNPRNVDLALVKAQETRRIVDRLYGYEVSPLLWKKVKRGLSAGRVQSVAMRLLVEKERERLVFKSGDYWDLKAKFSTQKGESFDAELTHIDDKRIASGKDFNPTTGILDPDKKVVLLNEETANVLKDSLLKGTAKVLSLEEKAFTDKPAPPFTTSTLQQEASRKLRFTAQRTMKIAQTLYENGLITYMRTDSTNLSEEAIKGARNLIAREFGENYLPDEPRIYKTKVKNAQEAHEAIRPAGQNFVSLSEVHTRFGIEAYKVYELIWKRTIASQMKDAQGTRLTASIGCENTRFRASGKTILFPGFLRAYVEGSDDPEAELADQEKILPHLEKDEELTINNLDALKHSTVPAARYTEGSLIKELERLGIGRPSTWAAIVGVILSRGYAFKRGTALVPTFLAMILTKLMEQNFTHLVDYNFTAQFEDDLDSISRGEGDNLNYLRLFYFGNEEKEGLRSLVESGEKNIDPRAVCGFHIGKNDQDKEIEVRIGRYGAFITNGEKHVSVPPMLAPDELTVSKAEELLASSMDEHLKLGEDPETKEIIYFIKNGPYGPYVQVGESRKDKKNPNKTASLLNGMSVEEVDLDLALKLLSLPRTLGAHPTMNEEIVAANGRYGPYVKCGKDSRSLPPTESPLTVTLERAIEIFAEPKRRGRGVSSAASKALGKHPTTEKEIALKDGRYGPYVTDGTINAPIPKGTDLNSLTLDDAVNLLELRASKLAEVESHEDEETTTTKKRVAKKTS